MVGIQSHLLVVIHIVLTLDLSRRCLRSSLYRCLLCPVGEVFEDEKHQPPYGVGLCVLWADRHRRKREATKPRSGTHPVPCSVESGYLTHPGGESDFGQLLGGGNPDTHESDDPP